MLEAHCVSDMNNQAEKNYHVGVGVLLLDDVPVGVCRLLLIIRKQLLQGRQGSVSLGFLLVGAPPFELLPVNFHLRNSQQLKQTNKQAVHKFNKLCIRMSKST